MLVISAQNCTHGFQTEQFSQSSNQSFSTDPQISPTTPTLDPIVTPTPQPSASPMPVHVSVPLYSSVDSSTGILRHSLYVQIGNSAPIQVLLDTGSSGLRIYSSVLSSSTYTPTNTPNQISYGSGLVVKGTLGMATVTIGGVSTPQPIAIQVITSDNLGTAGVNPILNSSGTGGPFGGYYGILGARLADANGAASPFVALGSEKWIIDLAVPNVSTMGTLTLNPTPTDLMGFTLFGLPTAPQGSGGWDDSSLSMCVNDLTAGYSVCQKTLMDSGAFNIKEYGDQTVATNIWPAGDSAELVYTSEAGQTVTQPFTIASTPGTKVVLPHTTQGTGGTNTGQYMFYNYSVLYDYVNGNVGLKHR